MVCGLATAQNATIKGFVTDSTTTDPLVGAEVYVNGKLSAQTDFNGSYTLSTAAGNYTIIFKALGYPEKVNPITLKPAETLVLNIALSSVAQTTGFVVVTGSQYEKRINEETVSIDIIKDYIIKNNASPSLSDVVGRTPGVSILDGQVNIRGGTGYAYGVGSRVMMLVDGMPMVRGDWGDINWNFIPLENIDQVEVIKGASSVLYGSAALNGVISVRTAWPTSEIGETRVQLYNTVYFNPAEKSMRWWRKSEQPFATGGFFNHRRKIKNLDLVIGGNINNMNSYLAENDSRQARFTINTRIHSKKIEGLIWGINTNFMYNRLGRVIFWANTTDGAYKPFGAGTPNSVSSDESYFNISVDPTISYANKRGGKHILRTRFYTVSFIRENNFNNYNNLFFAEYQYMKKFKWNGVLTTGLAGSTGLTLSTNIGNATANTYYGGIYAQYEQKLLDDRLALVGGVRYETNVFTPPRVIGNNTVPEGFSIVDFSIPVFRFGLNYALNEGNNIRASWGQGFRSPSIIERYVTASLGALNFFANPALRPENGWNAELAYKKLIVKSNIEAYFDVSLFWNEYYDMTEFVFGAHSVTDPLTGVTTTGIGFQNQNLQRSRIAGFEVSGNGEWKINKNSKLRFFGGYTYLYPGDLNADTTLRNVGNYFSSMFGSIFSVDSEDAARMLTYRINHTFKLDLEYEYKRFKAGVVINYTSFMNRIDPVFEAFIPGLQTYRVENNTGFWVFDSRVIYEINKNSSVGFVFRNMDNKIYSTRPGLFDAPSNLTVQYTTKF